MPNFQSLRSSLISPLSATDTLLKIKYLKSDGKQNLSTLSFDIPDHITNNIKKLTFPLYSHAKDTPHWSLYSNGMFSAKSVYSIINAGTTFNIDFQWIWKLSLPDKIKKNFFGNATIREYPPDPISII